MIDVDRIPAEIRALDRWVIWKRKVRDDRSTKVPYIAGDPERKAKSNDPSTWRSFETAVGDYEDGKCDGIGFCLGDGWSGADFDDCILDSGEIEQEELDPSTGELRPGAAEFVRQLDSYTETSPSGAGLKALVRGPKPVGRCKRGCTWESGRRGAIEMYDRGRFFTITGRHLAGTPTTIEDRTDALARVHALVFPKPGTNSHRLDPQPLDLSDHELIDKALGAKNGSKFGALWNGDTSGHASRSEADLALCSLLAFWAGRDAGRMDRLFRSSGLIRKKWDERRGEQTYGQQTIGRAIEGSREIYTPRRTQASTATSYDADGYDKAEREAIQAESREAEEPEDPEPEIAELAPFSIVTPPDSFIARYVEHVKRRTDAPEAAHELMAVGILSALAGPRPRIKLATSPRGMSLCIWTDYIVDSTTGRKSTVIGFAHEVLERVLGAGALIEWEGSPQGLIQRLQDRDGRAAVFVRDEYSGLLAQMNRGGHTAGLAQTFIRAFDGAVLENIRTRKKNKQTGVMERDTDRVENPYLVKLTATTWESFVGRATIDNVLDGFLARFVFVTGAAQPRRIEIEDEGMEREFGQLVGLAADYYQRASGVERIDPSADVLDAAWQLEQDWMERAQESVRPDAAGPALKRLADTVLKTSALLAIERSEHGSRVGVALADFEAARAMGERWAPCTLRVIEALGSTKFRRDCEAVAKTIHAQPNGVKLEKLYRAHRNLRKRDFDEILEALETQGIARPLRLENERGRPGVMYVPITRRAA